MNPTTSRPLTKHSQPFNTFLLFSILSLTYKTKHHDTTKKRQNRDSRNCLTYIGFIFR